MRAKSHITAANPACIRPLAHRLACTMDTLLLAFCTQVETCAMSFITWRHINQRVNVVQSVRERWHSSC